MNTTYEMPEHEFKKLTEEDWNNVLQMRDIEMAETGNCPKAALMARELLRPLVFGDKINWKSARTDSETWEDVWSETYFIALEALRDYNRSRGSFVTYVWGEVQALARKVRNGDVPEYQLRQKNVEVVSYDELQHKSTDFGNNEGAFQIVDENFNVENVIDSHMQGQALDLFQKLVGPDMYAYLNNLLPDNLDRLSQEDARAVAVELEFFSKLLGGFANWPDEFVEDFSSMLDHDVTID